MRPHRPDSDHRSPSASTTNGYSARRPRNVWSGAVPGMRQRTSRPSVPVSDSRIWRAAVHSSSGGTAARRRWRVRTAGPATQSSSCSSAITGARHGTSSAVRSSPATGRSSHRIQATDSRGYRRRMVRAGKRRLLLAACGVVLVALPVSALAVTRDGTNLADTLRGTPANDVLRGHGSRDQLFGAPGNDLLSGGSAADVLLGEDGDDDLDGASGNDRLDGGPGNDRLLGVTGNDVLDGGPGNDFLDGFDGDDIARGGDGNDFVADSRFGDDRLLDGGPGDGVVIGNGGIGAQVLGGDGNDVLSGGTGNDGLDGGPGDDILFPGSGQFRGRAAIGGPGNDTIVDTGSGTPRGGGRERQPWAATATTRCGRWAPAGRRSSTAAPATTRCSSARARPEPTAARASTPPTSRPTRSRRSHAIAPTRPRSPSPPARQSSRRRPALPRPRSPRLPAATAPAACRGTTRSSSARRRTSRCAAASCARRAAAAATRRSASSARTARTGSPGAAATTSSRAPAAAIASTAAAASTRCSAAPGTTASSAASARTRSRAAAATTRSSAATAATRSTAASAATGSSPGRATTPCARSAAGPTSSTAARAATGSRRTAATAPVTARSCSSPIASASMDLDAIARRALDEDVGAGDVTTRATVPPGARARARITQKQPGVVFGLDAAEATFRALDPDVRIERRAAEGEWRGGGSVLDLQGRAAALLTAERTALNFLQRLSGVATLTARYVDAIAGTGARVLDTRKTTPGLRALEKAAVAAGGGTNHRAGLYDAVLIKENHAAMAGGVAAAVEAGGASSPGVPLEVECRTLAEVEEALAAHAPRLLLDNMAPALLREAVARVEGRAELEASGGVTLGTIREIAGRGVHFVSVYALTHSALAMDLSLLLEPLP